jgi:uncharacterized damage-inducible protein DinB
MSESARIVDQLKRAFDGNAWHGPALLEILGDVDAATAAARPIPNAHTIWELTLHVGAWEGAILRRIGGEPSSLNDEQNFPEIKDNSPAAWMRAVESLKQTHEQLLNAISAMSDSRLLERVPGKDYDFYFMFHGAAQHALYHAGQMVILKRARK